MGSGDRMGQVRGTTADPADWPGAGPRARSIAAGQSAFYVATGIWPLLSMRSFEAVTGPKREDWLVKTAGTLIAVVGATLGAAALRGRVTPEIRLLGAGSAAALAAVDVIYASQGRISPVYLLDAVVEAGIVAAWAAADDVEG